MVQNEYNVMQWVVWQLYKTVNMGVCMAIV